MKILNEQDYKELVRIFESNEDYDQRVKAHIPVLYEKYIGVDQIMKIYNINKETIYVLLDYIKFFGLKDYFKYGLNDLSKRVVDEEYRQEQVRLKKSRSLFYYLFYPLRLIFGFLTNLSKMATVLIAYLMSFFLPNRRNGGTNDVNNTAIIQKGSSFNYIVQIGTLNVMGEEIKEYLVTNSKNELTEKVEEFIKTEKKFELGNKQANKLFDKAQRDYSDKSIPKDIRDSKVRFYAILIIGVLLYSTTFKGGISSISILGVAIAVSIRAYMPNPNVTTDTLIPLPPSSSQVDSSGRAVDEVDFVDSIEISDQGNKAIVIDNVQEYKRAVPEWYDYDANCLALSAMGPLQRKFITKYDRVDHYNENYYIDQYDDMYYLCVVSYKDIREAAFQMHFINDNTEFTSMVLESLTNQGTLYAVVIGKFRGNEISETCALIDKWNKKCITGNAEIGYIYNGG